jgi:pSer/pThr/pTyr-binding forkhead associated (FHA) protein
MGKWHVVLNDRPLDTFWVQEGQSVTIGRGETADVRIDNVAVSRQHATLELRNGTHYLTDLGSVNGTLVNGEKVKGTMPVTGADLIEIGKFSFILLPEPERVRPGRRFADFEATLLVKPKGKPGPRIALAQGKATPPEFFLDKKKTAMVGKDASCNVRVPGWLVGKVQCYIRPKEDQYYLTHVAGWRRTTLNGRKVRREKRLRKGDIIGIGGTKLKFG